MKPTLYMLVGIPGCGKSTWASTFSKQNNIPIVSRDQIRFNLVKEDDDYFAYEKLVFSNYAMAISKLLQTGHDVIADATHINNKSRTKLLKRLDRYYKDYNIIFVTFTTSLKQCLLNNQTRNGRAQVPESVIYRMANQYVAPVKEEDDRCQEIWELGVTQ